MDYQFKVDSKVIQLKIFESNLVEYVYNFQVKISHELLWPHRDIHLCYPYGDALSFAWDKELVEQLVMIFSNTSWL